MVNNQFQFIGTITKVYFANDKVCKFDISTKEPQDPNGMNFFKGVNSKNYDVPLTAFEPGIIEEVRAGEGSGRICKFYGYAYKNNYKNREGNWVNETTLCVTQVTNL